VVLTLFSVLTGWFFFNLLSRFIAMLGYFQVFRRPDLLEQLNLNAMVMEPLFYNMLVVLLIFVPALTMRLLAEEKKLRTAELLLTSPLTTVEIITGKFLASLIFLAILIGITFIFPALLFYYGDPAPEQGPIVAGYLGLFLTGAAYLSIGLFASSLTENQIVAFVVGVFLLFLFYVISWPAGAVGSTLGGFLHHLSLPEQFQDFAKGIIDTTAVVFYLSFSLFWLFLTQRVMDSARWR